MTSCGGEVGESVNLESKEMGDGSRERVGVVIDGELIGGL
jgi:hypothetical protein